MKGSVGYLLVVNAIPFDREETRRSTHGLDYEKIEHLYRRYTWRWS